MTGARTPADTPADFPSPSGPVRLGALEQQVMDVLWDEGPSSIRDVIRALGGRLAYTTIATVMTNLDRKGMIVSSRQGRSVQYAAQHSRPVHAARVMGQVLAGSKDRSASILHFVETMDQRDLQLLREYLDARSQDRPGDDNA